MYRCISDKSYGIVLYLSSEIFNDTMKTLKIMIKEYGDEVNYAEVMIEQETDPL